MEDTKINLKRYVRLILNKDIVIFGVEKYCSFINHSQVVDIFFFSIIICNKYNSDNWKLFSH
jgi:hypothetical protein